MPTPVGRPSIEDETVVVTLRIPKKYHVELTALAVESGIRSTPAYSAFILIQHVIGVMQAKRHAEIEAALG